MKLDEKEYIELEEELWPENKQVKRYGVLFLKGLSFVVLIGVIFGFGMLFQSSFDHSKDNTSIQKIDSVFNILKDKWYYGDQIENLDEVLVDNAIAGMTYSDLDLHTNYIPISYVDNYQSSVDATGVGIGVSYVSGEQLTITRVFKGSPAEKAGIQVNDIIISVDGQDANELEASGSIKDAIIGEIGTEVNVGLKRGDETIEVTCTRDIFSGSAYGEILDNNIGYFSISDFGATTSEDAKAYLDEMINAGVEKLIIDLRQDSGGYITTLQSMASLFIPEDKLCIYTQDKDGNRNDIYTLGGNYTQFKEYVLLVDEGSASASEGFTLAMKENLENVTVVGTTTYGKGTMQDSYSLLDGSLLKITTGKWFSPSGMNVEGEGITPDIEVDLHPILTMAIYEYDETVPHSLDTVSQQNIVVQAMLDYLGYPVDRMDGYFDQSSQDALEAFCASKDLDASNGYTYEIYEALFDELVQVRSFDKSKDEALNVALEVLSNG